MESNIQCVNYCRLPLPPNYVMKQPHSVSGLFCGCVWRRQHPSQFTHIIRKCICLAPAISYQTNEAAGEMDEEVSGEDYRY